MRALLSAPIEIPGKPSGVWVRTSGRVVLASTMRSTGDFALDSVNVSARRAAVTGGRPVVYPRQVHGHAVVVEGLPPTPECKGGLVQCAGELPVGGEFAVGGHVPVGDAVVGLSRNVAIAVITADCAPVALWTEDEVIAVIHAGWRGLVAGVIEAAVCEVRARSARPDTLRAVLGPCIGPCCYEFGRAEIETVVARYGDTVRSTTTGGVPSLDMWAGVQLALRRVGVAFDGHLTPDSFPACTACDERWFSWRRNRDIARQAMFAWVTAG